MEKLVVLLCLTFALGGSAQAQNTSCTSCLNSTETTAHSSTTDGNTRGYTETTPLSSASSPPDHPAATRTRPSPSAATLSHSSTEISTSPRQPATSSGTAYTSTKTDTTSLLALGPTKPPKETAATTAYAASPSEFRVGGHALLLAAAALIYGL